MLGFNMAIKALFIDLDGTLLTSKKEVTPVTLATLGKCKAKGIKLFVATGRSPRSIQNKDWGKSLFALIDGGVFCNGGQILFNGDETFEFIPDEVSRKTLEFVKKYDAMNIGLHLESHDEKWAFRFLLSDEGYRNWGLLPEASCTLDATPDLRTVKILIFYGRTIDYIKQIDSKLVKELEKLCHGKAQFHHIDKGTVIMIVAKDADKNIGIEKIRSKLNFTKNEIVTFGDDFNCLEMIAGYENSVAMGNAEDIIKNKAKYITLDNDSDGVHHAIVNILKLV